MIRRHGNHPYFVAGHANHLWELGAVSIAERMYHEVQVHLLADVAAL